MKKFALIILFGILAFSAHGQTIKSLGYNATNGQVVVATNIVWTNNVTFSNLAASGNVTMSGTANTAPNQTAASGASVMTRDLGDDRYYVFATRPTNVLIYSNAKAFMASDVFILRGIFTAQLTNELVLWTNTIPSLSSWNYAGSHEFQLLHASNSTGFAAARGAAQGNQGMQLLSEWNIDAENSAYWISFTTNLTVTTGGTISGNASGATAKIWHSSNPSNSSRTDVWLYDVRGALFTTNDTNLILNGTNTGVGIANSLFGANPTARMVTYLSRDGTNTVPAVFVRHTNQTNYRVFFNYQIMNP